jgi:hypothetical protein
MDPSSSFDSSSCGLYILRNEHVRSGSITGRDMASRRPRDGSGAVHRYIAGGSTIPTQLKTISGTSTWCCIWGGLDLRFDPVPLCLFLLFFVCFTEVAVLWLYMYNKYNSGTAAPVIALVLMVALTGTSGMHIAPLVFATNLNLIDAQKSD